MTTPYEFADLYDSIVLGTRASPGKVTLSNHDRVKNWDVQAAKGSTGASSALNGDPIGRFNALFEFADDRVGAAAAGVVSQFDEWEDFQKLIESMTDGKTPKALPIYHPDLARNHYTEVSGAKIGGVVHDGKGGSSCMVEFIEYKPPKAKPAAKAKGAPAGAGTPGKQAKPDPNADLNAQLAALVAEARKP